MRWCTEIDKYEAWLDVWLHLSLYCKLYENFMIYPTVFLAKILSAIYSQWENRKRVDQPHCVSYLSITLSKVFDPFHHYPVAKHVEFMHNTEHLTYKMHFWAVSMWYCLKSKKRSNGLYIGKGASIFVFHFVYWSLFNLKKGASSVLSLCLQRTMSHISPKASRPQNTENTLDDMNKTKSVKPGICTLLSRALGWDGLLRHHAWWNCA